MSGRPLMSGPKVCALLGNISHQTLTRLALSGQIAFVQVRSRRKFKPEDVEAFLAENRRHGRQANELPEEPKPASATSSRHRKGHYPVDDRDPGAVIRAILKGL